MEVTIRSGEPRDVEAVWRLMNQLAEHEGLGHVFELTSEGLHRSCFGEPRRIELIVAASDGKVVGYRDVHVSVLAVDRPGLPVPR